MPSKLKSSIAQLTLTQQFMLAGFIILVIGAIGLGRWAGYQIEQIVVHRTAETTALFVDSFIAPNMQPLASTGSIGSDPIANLDRLLEDTPLGRHIVAFKVWDQNGRVLYSAEPEMIGQVFPVSEGLAAAWRGEVSSSISDLASEENILERAESSRLLETYAPVRLAGSDRIIAVAEFYQSVDDLQGDIRDAQRLSWLVVAAAMAIIYALLSGFISRAAETIARQQSTLSAQVSQLTELLVQNDLLHDRVRRAAARTTALNERVLRRISAELHDGPVQDVGLALLRVDHVMAHLAEPGAGNGTIDRDLNIIQASMQRALGEIRALSAGIGMPQLSDLTLPQALERAVRVHEQRSGIKVVLDLDGTPDRATLPVKITLYRLVQEALHNAYRHAGGAGQKVCLHYDGENLHVEVSDSGPGMRDISPADWDQHLGLAGMRERVESLGGTFHVESVPGRGTRVMADLDLSKAENDDER